MPILNCVANPYGIVFNCSGKDESYLYIKNDIIMGFILSECKSVAKSDYKIRVKQNIDDYWGMSRKKYKRSLFGAFQYFATSLISKKHNDHQSPHLSEMGLPRYIFAAYYERKRPYLYCIDLQNDTVSSAPFGRFYFGPEAKEFESLLSTLNTGEISLEDLIEITSGFVELSLMNKDKKNKEEVNVSTHILTYQGKVRKVHIKNRTAELINEKIRNRKKAIQNHKEIEEEIENLRRERLNDLKIDQMKQVIKYRSRERERERER